MTEKLVVIGAGMASGRALEHLLEADPCAYDVTLFGAEPRGNYNRIMLSPVLSGEKTYEEIVTHDADWYADNGITCRFGETITEIDRARKMVISEAGETPYDKLMVATGSAPFIIPVPGKNLRGYLLQRELEGRGIKVMCNASTKAILGTETVDAVLLEDGSTIDADIVIMAAGIRPETRLAVDAGLHVERGIVVDDQMRTNEMGTGFLASSRTARTYPRCAIR